MNSLIPLIHVIDERRRTPLCPALCLRGAAADLAGLTTLLVTPNTDLVSQQATAYYLVLLGPDAKPAVPVVRRILQQGARDPRVAELLQSFLRKAAE